MRKYPKGKDDFEQHLYLSMEGIVLLHSFVNPEVALEPEDYRGLDAGFQGSAPELTLVQYGVQMSEAFSKGRKRISEGKSVGSIALQAQLLQQKVQGVVDVLRNRLYELDRSKHSMTTGTRLHADYQRSYGRGLAMYAILLCARKTLSPDDHTIQHDVEQLCSQALQLENEARVYLPLGWRFAWIMLMPIWCATSEVETNDSIRDVLLKGTLHSDNEGPSPMARQMFDVQLELMAKRLSLCE